MSNEYIKVDIKEYVKNGIESGKLVSVEAIKYSRIIARQGNAGENVILWSVNQNGEEVKEKDALVTIDQTTGQAGWIATNLSCQTKYAGNEIKIPLNEMYSSNKTDYRSIYRIFKYLLDNYDKDYIIKLISDIDIQKKDTEKIYNEAINHYRNME